MGDIFQIVFIVFFVGIVLPPVIGFYLYFIFGLIGKLSNWLQDKYDYLQTRTQFPTFTMSWLLGIFVYLLFGLWLLWFNFIRSPF